MQTQDLITAVLERLAEHGVTVVELVQDPRAPEPLRLRPDARLTLAVGGRQLEYAVEAKRALTPTTLGTALARLHDRVSLVDRPGLLVADYITPPLAEKLKAAGQQFADTAGNAYLGAEGVLVWVCGRKRPEARKARPGRTFTTGGIKVLFALLRAPHLVAKPYRHIAVAAGVALGTVPGVLDDLAERGKLLGKRNRRRLVDLPRLLDEWTTAYGRTLYPRNLLRTMTTPTFDDWPQWKLTGHDAIWGAEPAARLLVGHLRPGALTIYGRTVPGRLVLEQRMTEPPPGTTRGLVHFRGVFWGPDADETRGHDVVHPLLVYADLLATGDGRCIETAAIVREQHLAGLVHN